MASGLSRPLSALARRLKSAPVPGSDTELLERYIRDQDASAFESLVRRHGPAVRGIARMRLGNAADADDVFQATFLVLARDAHRIRGRESVAGWLVRVAHLSALQLRRNRARRASSALPEDLPNRDPSPEQVAISREECEIVLAAIAGLPDRFRGVLLLCALEGRTSAEAARLLGVPQGTVDSRLATAKAKLASLLRQRGLAAIAGLTVLEQLRSATAGLGFDGLVLPLVNQATLYATGTFDATAISGLADGVATTMTTLPRLLAVGLVAVALTGTAGLGVYSANAQLQEADKAKAQKPTPKKAEEQRELVTPPKQVPEEKAKLKISDEVQLREALSAPSALKIRDGTITLGMLIEKLNELGIPTWADMAALSRAGAPEDFRRMFFELTLEIHPMPTTASLADRLNSLLSQYDSLNFSIGFRIRGTQLVIGPRIKSPTALTIELSQERLTRQLFEHKFGPPISYASPPTGEPFTTCLEKLRLLTGENLIIDPRCKELANGEVIGTFDAVPMFTVLRILSDMVGLKLVIINNVYYFTDPQRAKVLQAEIDAELAEYTRLVAEHEKAAREAEAARAAKKK